MNDWTHVSLRVRSLEESSAFYAALLGVEPDKRTSRYARFRLERPALVLALQAAEDSGACGAGALEHLGLRYDSAGDYDAARERLVGAGLVRKEQRATRCCHAVQDKVWVRDPDGIAWEVYRVLEDLPVVR